MTAMPMLAEFRLFGIFGWIQILCIVLLIAIVAFYMNYRKRQM